MLFRSPFSKTTSACARLTYSFLMHTSQSSTRPIRNAFRKWKFCRSAGVVPTLTRSRGGDGDGCSASARTRTAYRPSACLAAIGQTIGNWSRLQSRNLHGLDNMASASSGLQLIPKSIASATAYALRPLRPLRPADVDDGQIVDLPTHSWISDD